MKNAVEIFERTFWNDMSSSIRFAYKDKAEKAAAMNVDF